MAAPQRLWRLARLEQEHWWQGTGPAGGNEVLRKRSRGEGRAFCICGGVVCTAFLRRSRTGVGGQRPGTAEQRVLGNRRTNSKPLVAGNVWRPFRTIGYSFLACGHQSFLDEPDIPQP